MHLFSCSQLTDNQKSGSGTACTCAVTEYHFHDRDDFVVNVDYITIDELKLQFEELLRAYRDYNLLPRASSNQTDEAGDGHERNRLRSKADLAKQTFKASFGANLERTPTVLSSMPFDHAITTMMEWASQELPWQGGQETFSTVEECSSRLRDLSSESDPDSATSASRVHWPFIRKLRVHLKAHILSKGLIIADLPGLRDLNSARKAITERYVRQCNQIFVVARIDRAITDESVKEIFELARNINLSRVDVVCTRSEDVNVREARHDWLAQRSTITELQESLDTAADNLSSVKDNLNEFDGLTDLSQEESKELARLEGEYRRAETSRLTHEFALQSHIIKLRNDKVSTGLKHQYRNHPIATTSNTFCISNKLYWDNRHKPSSAAMPYLRLSGIMELRRHCIGIVAQSRLRATRDFVRDDIPAFLSSVVLWVEAGSGNASAESKQQTLDAVAAIQKEIDEVSTPALSSPLADRYK